MSRDKGTFNLSANYEPRIQVPLDARMLVGNYTDLIDPSIWKDDGGLVWLFDGAIVVVAEDPSAGIYWLRDSANYTNYTSWEIAGSATPYDPSILYSYIDGSLAQRDASITDLYSRIDIIDSSISYLVKWNSSQDSSIERIDASITNLYSLVGDSSVTGAINIGVGSANIFAAIDSSRNIELRTLSAAGAATVTQTGDDIIIGLDASFAGEINYGDNVGSGDASIYVQKVGDALQFREILAGSSQIIVDVSGNLIVIDASIDVPSPSGESIDGGVWITDITPTSGGNVGDQVYSSDGNVLDSCLTDVSALTVHVLALPGHTNYLPVVFINSNPVSLSEGANQPLWDGTYIMEYDFLDASITVHHEDGAQWSTTVDADTPAQVLSAEFTGGYPGSQTELKAGDAFDVSIVTDVPITSVEVDGFGALQAGTFSVSGTNVGFTATIANQGTSLQSLGMRIRVVKSTGSTSVNYLSSSQGSVDGKDLVDLDNTYPGISFGTIAYPTGQLAIKSPEDASVANTVTNYDTLTYSSPSGEIGFFGGTGTYQNPKRVQYTGGTYNISSNNLRIVANRAANDATTTNNTVVWIANTPATLSVSNGATRFISGGNDGTAAQNHSITINANGQRLLAAPTLVKGSGGTWQGGGFSWTAPATSFTRALQVHDNEIKGGSTWGAISGTNLAGIVTSTNSGATIYTLGGFITRDVAVGAFGIPPAQINVEITDYSKVPSTLNWFNGGKQLPNKRIIGTTAPPADPNSWAADLLNNNPTTINILDTATSGSVSAPSTIRISESA